MQGKIVKNISNLYTVLVDNKTYDCHARGKFKNNNITPLVGDDCIIDVNNNYILEILPRINYLERPRVSNVNIGLIVTSVKEPKISLNLLDKEISSIVLNNIEPVIVFSKLDLLNKEETKVITELRNYYEKIGYKVFYNTEIDKIKDYLKSKEIVVTGQTGAGKSSFINSLGDFKIKTNEISHHLGRGKHTTRHAEIYDSNGIKMIDTPGFSSLEIKCYTKEEIRSSFKEFNNDDCQFKDCMHDKELKCGVKKRVLSGDILKSRYDNYLDFLKEASK
jgi:ribosome biogenesis GTPase / thiamine phosphate phosphatase